MWIKLVVIVLILTIAFFIVFNLVRSQPPQEEEETSEKIEENVEVPEDPPIIITGGVLRGWEKGLLSWTLEADEMRLNKQSSRATCPNGLELVVFDEKGEVKSTLKGNKGFINLDNKDFQLVDTVEVLSTNGNRIESFGIIYRDNSKTIEGFALSKIFFDDNYIECQNFISDLDFENPVFEIVQNGKFVIGEKSANQ
ncbi:MAG TPA: LPS export ABC transporter periplasmic protein LptC [Candidatus Atribacteria bacterium]|nr:LPS export ABC transporter periplasmic protein LptC [Candidatus Atribacteria bacterium]HCU22841.1 LPS export ABC transporter periplasmic protein LptC [Candidatus Atribacteria bacterium]